MRSLYQRTKHFFSLSYRSISGRMLLTSLLLILIPLSLTGVYGYLTFSKNMEASAHQYSLQILGKLRQQVDDMFQQIDDTLVAIWIHRDLQVLIQEPPSAWREHPSEYFNVVNHITNLMGWRKGNKGLFIITSNGGVLHELMPSAIKPDYPFTEEPFFKRSTTTRVPIIWGPHPQEYVQNAPVFSIARPLLQTPSMTWHGAILYDLDVDQVYRLFDSIQLGQSGFVMVVDPEGETVYRPDNVLVPNLADNDQWDTIRTSQAGSLVTPMNGKLHLVTYETSHLSGWKLIGIVPLHELNEGATKVKNTMLAVGMLTVAVGFVLMLQLIRIILKPLHQLNRAITKLGQGEFSANIPLPQLKELHVIVGQYNRSVQMLRQLTEELYVSKLRQQEAELAEQKSRLLQQEFALRAREAELTQLQAQINPHFLYNTLSCIDSMAEADGVPRIREAVSHLSRVLHHSMQGGSSEVAFAEEWKQIEAFIAIQNYRHGDRIRVVTDLDERTMEAAVFTLTVQPLIENAYFHGLEQQLSGGTICIRTTVEDGMLSITVSDDGAGMSADSLARVRQFIDHHGATDGQRIERYSGLYNVIRRMFLAYGDKCRISIESELDHGTTVTLQFPYRKYPS